VLVVDVLVEGLPVEALLVEVLPVEALLVEALDPPSRVTRRTARAVA
jgi:hypothetical protein